VKPTNGKDPNKLHRTIDEDRKLIIQVRFDAILFLLSRELL
jgi:hypothetical protein